MTDLATVIGDPRRLEALLSTGLLDTEPDEDFDRLTRLASRLLKAPVSLVSLVDDRRQFFKSIAGRLPSPWHEARETPLSHSFCKHVVAEGVPLVVGDAPADPRVSRNRATIELGVVAYLGMPLVDAGGQALGSFCVIDERSRSWTDEEQQQLRELADLVLDRIQLRSLGKFLHASNLQLRQLELQRDELVHMVVHDLRGPLTAMIGGLEVLESSQKIADGERRFVTMALRSSERLLRMIGNILDVNKAEAGKLALEVSEFDALALARDAAEQMRYLAEPRRVAIQVRAAPGLPPLRADHDKLLRVLLNLVGNAVQHTPSGGEVRMSVAAGDDGFSFAVEDCGSGIPREAFGKLFEKFGQAATKKLHGASTGLGLPFARLAVEAHGGRIWVESEPGQGATFRFTIPRAAR